MLVDAAVWVTAGYAVTAVLFKAFVTVRHTRYIQDVIFVLQHKWSRLRTSRKPQRNTTILINLVTKQTICC